jgi:hypothetical protein
MNDQAGDAGLRTAQGCILTNGESHVGSVGSIPLDVLLVVQAGVGLVTIDGVEHDVATDSVILIPKGSSRSIAATRRMLYFSVHQRRERLGLGGLG